MAESLAQTGYKRQLPSRTQCKVNVCFIMVTYEVERKVNQSAVDQAGTVCAVKGKLKKLKGYPEHRQTKRLQHVSWGLDFSRIGKV